MYKLCKRFINVRNNIKSIGVVGAGQMGIGIGLTGALKAQKDILFYDSNDDQINNGKEIIKNELNKLIELNKINNDDMNNILGCINYTNNLNDFKNIDFVIEAVTEKKAIKESIFNQLNNICNDDVILTTNTSTIPINQIASYTNNSQRMKLVCGMHFMNPVPRSKLIEIIPSQYTHSNVVDIVKQLSTEFGKVYSESKDVVGFIANRILMPYINEAVFVLYEGIASKEDIDKTMRLGTNIPMGPLELCDFIGIDTCLFIQETIYNETNNEKYRVCPLFYDMINNGKYGCKNGYGFYEYDKPGSYKKKELTK